MESAKQGPSHVEPGLLAGGSGSWWLGHEKGPTGQAVEESGHADHGNHSVDRVWVPWVEEEGEEERELSWRRGRQGGGEVGNGEPGEEEKGEGKEEAEKSYGEDMENPPGC